jgi:hypothetical protein
VDEFVAKSGRNVTFVVGMKGYISNFERERTFRNHCPLEINDLK